MKLVRNSFYSSSSPYPFTSILGHIPPHTIIQRELYSVYLFGSSVLTAQYSLFYLRSSRGIKSWTIVHYTCYCLIIKLVSFTKCFSAVSDSFLLEGTAPNEYTGETHCAPMISKVSCKGIR